jgi:hypothetical protein
MGECVDEDMVNVQSLFCTKGVMMDHPTIYKKVRNISQMRM